MRSVAGYAILSKDSIALGKGKVELVAVSIRTNSRPLNIAGGKENNHPEKHVSQALPPRRKYSFLELCKRLPPVRPFRRSSTMLPIVERSSRFNDVVRAVQHTQLQQRVGYRAIEYVRDERREARRKRKLAGTSEGCFNCRKYFMRIAKQYRKPREKCSQWIKNCVHKDGEDMGSKGSDSHDLSQDTEPPPGLLQNAAYMDAEVRYTIFENGRVR